MEDMESLMDFIRRCGPSWAGGDDGPIPVTTPGPPCPRLDGQSRATSGQDSKSGKFAYYVCQSLLKRGSGTCGTPRLNARRFEGMIAGQIREKLEMVEAELWRT